MEESKCSKIPNCLSITIFAAILGMFQFGFNTGVMNAPQNVIEDFIANVYKERYAKDIDKNLTGTIFSMAVSAFLIGGMVGALSGGWMANTFGRKKGLLYSQFLSIIGAILLLFSKTARNYEMIVIGRLLTGTACGLFTGLVPLFITEVLPPKKRGTIGTFNQVAITFGIFVSMILGLNDILGSENRWPILIGSTIVPSILQALLLLMIPESPRYLILEMKDEEAGRKALVQLRNTEDVSEELNEIKAEDSSESNNNSGSISVFHLLTLSKFRLALLVTICVHLSHQLSGMPAILYYSTKFFMISGVNCDASQYATLGIGAIMVVMSVLTLPLIEKLGRRMLHLAGMIGMIICLTLISIVLNEASLEHVDCSDYESRKQDESNVEAASIFAMIGTLSFVVFFSLGPGPIPWIITGEFYTQTPRSAAVALGTFANWSGNLMVGLLFPQMQITMAKYSFVPFTIIVIVLFLVLFFYMPETKEASVNEIESLFQIPNAWKIPIGYSSQALLMEIRGRYTESSHLLGST